MSIKREEQRLLNTAWLLIEGGAQIDLRLKNVIKTQINQKKSKDSYGMGERDMNQIRKFVDDARMNGHAHFSNQRNKSSVTHEDKALIAKALSYRESKPPADSRLRDFIDGVRKSSRPFHGMSRIGDHTRGMLRKYIEQCERPVSVKEEKKKFSGPQQLGMGLSGELELVTPEIAFSLLEVNERIGFHNRNISKDRVKFYADDMKSGRWRLTAEPLLIGKDGQLMNGQHRLHAVIDAEMSIPMLIVRGVDLGAFYSIDQAKPRSTGDVVGIVGVKNRTVVASVLKMIWVWENFGPAGLGGNNRDQRGFTNEIAAEMAKARDLTESIVAGNKVKALCPPSAATFCHWLCSTKSKAAADEFFELLHSGEGLKKGDPIMALRQRLITERSDPTSSVRRLAVIRMIMSIWNAHRKGRVLVKMPPIADKEVERPQ